MRLSRLRRSVARLTRLGRPGRLVVVATGHEAANLPEAALRAIGRSLARGEPVELVVLDFTWNAAPAAPDGVAVRMFWREGAPAAGEFAPARRDDLYAAPVPARDGEWSEGYYSDGLPVMRVRTGPAGRQVDHLAEWGAVVRRDEIDERGRLVRTVDVDPQTGEDATHRYVAGDGSCWLSVPLHATRPAGPVRQFKPAVRTYATLAEMQANWARTLVNRRSRVLAAGAESKQIVKGLYLATV
jgi:hypothetical protein